MVAHAPGRYPLACDAVIQQRLEREASSHEQRRAILNEYARWFHKFPSLAYRPAPTAHEFHKSSKPVRFLFGGNRSGKSRSSAQEVLWYATGTHPYKRIKTPNIGWYCTVSWEMVGSVLWATLEPLLKGFDYRVVSWLNKGRGIPYAVEVRTANGWSRILFKSYEQGRESFQGTERRWICNDEQFPEDIMQEQISRIGPGEALDMWAPQTPIDPQPWLEERVNVELPHDWDVFEMPLDENRVSAGGVIPDERIDATILSWPEEMRDTRRKGKFASFLGAVFKNFRRELHVLNEEEERSRIKFTAGGKIHGSVQCTGGIDFGGNNPFVYVLILNLGDDEWYVLDEYYWDYRIKGVRLMRDHAKAIIELHQKWGINPPNIWADHDKQDRYELEHEGVSTSPADKGMSKKIIAEGGVLAASGKRQLIETALTLFAVHPVKRYPRLRYAERCRHLIAQTIGLRWPEGTDTRDPQDAPVKKDDHAVDAMLYGVHSERGAVVEPIIVLDADQQFKSEAIMLPGPGGDTIPGLF